MKISVIVPSRLRANPTSDRGTLLLDRALMSVRRQSVCDLEMIVGLDASHPPIPERFLNVSWLKFVEAGDSQAKAVNAAMKAATGDVFALCEDDDTWRDHDKLGYQLELLAKHDFVSCNQREVDEDGRFIRVNNFATPSGWVMKREVWEKVGPMDETFRYHVDTEWLGRANAAGVNRCHLVPAGTNDDAGWLVNVARHSAIAALDEITEPMVDRFVSEEGGMSAIRKDRERIATELKAAGPPTNLDATLASGMTPWCVSVREHHVMAERYGNVPW